MQVQCPHCNEMYDVEKEQLGMTATCSVCNKTFVLSAPAAKEPFQKPARKKKKGPGIMEVLGPYIKLIVFVGLVGGGGYYLYSKGMLGNKPKVEEKKDQAQTENNLFKEKTVGDAAITASNIDAAIIQRDKDRGFVFSEDNKTLLKAPKKITSYTITGEYDSYNAVLTVCKRLFETETLKLVDVQKTEKPVLPPLRQRMLEAKCAAGVQF